MKSFLNVLKKIGNSIVEILKMLFIPARFRKEIVSGEEVSLSPGKIVARNFFTNKLAIVGMAMFAFLITLTFVASNFIPFNSYYSNPLQRNLPPNYSYLNIPGRLVSEGIRDIQSGIAFSIGLSEEGNVYGWGVNVKGVLDIPQEVKDADIDYISVGSQHAMAVSHDGDVFLWGYNHMEQAQIATRFVTALEADPIVEVFGGIDMTAAIVESGKVYVWGSGTDFTGSPLTASPYRMLDNSKVISVVMSYSNAVLLSDEGTIRAIGLANNIRLGIPDELKSNVPVENRKNIVQISMTMFNVLALDDDGNVYLWGSNSDGLTGEAIPAGALTDVKQIETGYNHAVVLKNDGTILAWGSNELGQTAVPTMTKPVEKLFVSGYQNYALHTDGTVTAWGHKGFLMGSDEMGRDFVQQIVHGGRITLTIGAIAVVISTFIGVIVGLLAGFFGGWVDNLLMRMAEVVSSFPFLPLAITLSAFLLGSSVTQLQQMFMIMVILGVLSWTGLARLIRGQVLSERERDYVLAARALGIKYHNIIIRHILPAVVNIVIVNFTLGYAGSLLTEAGLSFLGFGVQKPNPSWGNILTAAQSETAVLEFYWWRWIIPGLCLLLAALSINLIGDALRDAMDPRANER